MQNDELVICDTLDALIGKQAMLSEDQMLQFFSLIIDAVESDARFPEAIQTKDKIRDLISTSLCERVDYVFANDAYADYSPQTAFEVGACWGAYKILQEAMHEHREPQREYMRRRIVRDNASLFKAIAENPGISTNELCEELDITINDVINYEWKINEKMLMVVTLIAGKEKHYYLTPAAQESYKVYIDYLAKNQKKAKKHRG